MCVCVYVCGVQVPDATVWYGPDTYMGRNLAQLFTMLAELPDEEVRCDTHTHTHARMCTHTYSA